MGMGSKRDILESSRKIKRRRIFWKFAGFLFVIILFLSAVVGFFYIPKFIIKTISIEGNETIKKEVLSEKILSAIQEKYLGLIPFDNIFILPKGKIKEKLYADFFRLKNVSLNRQLPSGIEAVIEERKQNALFCQRTNECVSLDDDGYAFEKAPFFSGSAFVKFYEEKEEKTKALPFQFLEINQFKGLMSLVKLAMENGVKINEIILSKDDFYKVTTDEGWGIMVGEEIPFSVVNDNLKIALRELGEKTKKLDYIDFRLKNKIFYKFK